VPPHARLSELTRRAGGAAANAAGGGPAGAGAGGGAPATDTFKQKLLAARAENAALRKGARPQPLRSALRSSNEQLLTLS
jgi:hypothetical protein